jgi:pyrimidine operon attenuation protein/uracil phosphoribosyltransferase
MKIILKSEDIDRIISQLADRVISGTPDGCDIAVIGIRSRGEILGHRLCAELEKRTGKQIPSGTLDITLYRDDLNAPHGQFQQVRSTEIGFSVDNMIIILADDVLHTGRSARAAMDALIDLGRPKAIRLAVLIERSGREFPIQADYTGFKVDVGEGEMVQVHFVESDGTDEVFIGKVRVKD